MLNSAGPRFRSFHTTRWSLVRSATGDDETRAMVALEQLCSSYWYPIYAYIRRAGRSPHDAEDLTQGFFAKLLSKDTLAMVDREKGKLRTFLLTCLRRFMGDEYDRSMAQKRGASVLTSFSADWAEQKYAAEPSDTLTPDRLYQRRWALTVLEFSLQVLEDEYQAKGQDRLFQALRPLLGFKKQTQPTRYEDLAASLDMPVGTLKCHVSRLRDRWRELLFEQVSMTIDDASSDSIKAELAELLECL